MAIDMCSEIPSLGTSPRISFSHDLHRTDHDVSNENNPCRSDSSLLLDPNSDFNFCVGDGVQSTEQSSADELFSDGLIRPLQIQQRFVTNSKHISISKPKSVANLPPLPLPAPTSSENESKPQSKTFWKIKRSSSLHCDNSYKKSSFWSLPQLLRSNSTGSESNSKSTSHQKQNSQKQHKFAATSSSSSSSSGSVNVYSFSQKPPLKKNYGGGYGNGGGVRISPVLNVPPPYISRGTTNLFGLGSLFRNGKDHKKNKK